LDVSRMLSLKFSTDTSAPPTRVIGSSNNKTGVFIR
jgi:hypothetical protein